VGELMSLVHDALSMVDRLVAMDGMTGLAACRRAVVRYPQVDCRGLHVAWVERVVRPNGLRGWITQIPAAVAVEAPGE
jgi:hypothetical protein